MGLVPSINTIIQMLSIVQWQGTSKCVLLLKDIATSHFQLWKMVYIKSAIS